MDWPFGRDIGLPIEQKVAERLFVEYVAWDDVKCQSQHARPVAYLCLICVELQAIFGSI